MFGNQEKLETDQQELFLRGEYCEIFLSLRSQYRFYQIIHLTMTVHVYWGSSNKSPASKSELRVGEWTPGVSPV
jgi:hypothetical protein